MSMGFGGSNSYSNELNKLTGASSTANLYDPDKAYLQKLLAYEAYGPRGNTGSEVNAFNVGPTSTPPGQKAISASPPPTWQQSKAPIAATPTTSAPSTSPFAPSGSTARPPISGPVPAQPVTQTPGAGANASPFKPPLNKTYPQQPATGASPFGNQYGSY